MCEQCKYVVGDVIFPNMDKLIVMNKDNVKIIEEKRDAKFVGEFCLRNSDGNYVNEPVQIFWQKKPPIEGYSNYFATFVRNGKLFITSGESIILQEISAINVHGEVLYSRYRHDMRWSKTQRVAIDGGRDYTKIVGDDITQYMILRVIDGQLTVIEVK